MQIKIISSSQKGFLGQNEFNKLSGKFAGICYMPSSFEEIENENIEKTLKRANLTKQNGHHSVFDHEFITLYLENVPKLFAMLLNNEKFYTTSEKSARYTEMEMQGIEKELYLKWFEITKILITKKYGNEPYFTLNRINKLAQENARYFISVYTPTNLAYTVSYRQLNYIYYWLQNLDENSKLYSGLTIFAKEFCKQLEELGLIDQELSKGASKRKTFSLENTKDRKEYFGDVYCTKYLGSFASLAQAQRHRTLNYQIKVLEKQDFYVPKIIRKNEKLTNEWLCDMQKVKDLHPQGELIEIIERGTPEDFILKTKERLCTSAQLEVMEQTNFTLKKYMQNVEDEEIKIFLKQYDKGARCTCGFSCNSPCKFKEGINLEREI